MNHFLNSSFIIPNIDINIMIIAIIHTITPRETIKYFSFEPPKWIITGPTKMGIKEIAKSWMYFDIFLFTNFF